VPARIKAAFRTIRRRQGRIYACSGGFAFAFFIVLLSTGPEAFAARLGGAYYVDDAEIGKLGSCEIESWSSFAANGDRIAVFSPACVLNLGAPVELGTNIVNLRSDGEGDTIITLTAKTVPIPIGPSGFGLAIAGAVVYDPGHQTGNGAKHVRIAGGKLERTPKFDIRRFPIPVVALEDPAKTPGHIKVTTRN